MSMSWPYTAEVNPNRLAAEFVELNQYENEFAWLTSQNYHKSMGVTVRDLGDSDNPRPSGAMIAEFQDLKNDGGTELRIPMMVPENGPPDGYGNTDVTNAGSTPGIVYRKGEVHLISKVFDVVMGIEAQKLGGKALLSKINNASERARGWWTRYTDRDLWHTVYYGVSMALTNINTSVSGTRSTLTAHSHGNFFVQNNGSVARVEYGSGRPGSSAYEADCKAALEAIPRDSTGAFTTKTIEWLEYKAASLRIPYFQTKAGEYRVLIVHPSQLLQLKQDPRFENAVIAGGQGMGFEGPAFRNFQARWGQTLVFSSTKAFGVQESAGTVLTESVTGRSIPKYGPTNLYTDMNSVSTDPLKGALMVGPDMITKCYGMNPISFEGEYRVGALKKTLIMRAMQAYVLSDIFDQDGTQGLTAGDFYENTSSLVCFTYSPN